MYWGTIILAFFVCLIYNIIITKKYNIKAWKMIIITFLFFIVHWGVTYITAFIEAGLKTPPSSNGVRAWIYIPIFFYICSVMFKIDFRKLCDAMTPCLMLGVALGHVGCVFGECCHGFLYDGFGAIYNSKVGGMVFPTQIVECLFALLLFISYVIYNCKTKYKVSGRLYAVMLIFFQSSRVGFEFLRDNRKIFLSISCNIWHYCWFSVVIFYNSGWKTFCYQGKKFL